MDGCGEFYVERRESCLSADWLLNGDKSYLQNSAGQKSFENKGLKK
jgi:hypothetical protein